MNRSFLLLPGAALAAILLTTAAFADQTPQSTTATYGDWTLRCVTPAAPAPAAGTVATAPVKQCEIAQAIQAQGQQGPIAQVAIGADPATGGMRLVAQVPVGAWLPAGVTLALGDKVPPTPLAFKRCLPNACLADVDLSQALSDAMKALATPGQLTFQMTAGKDIGVPISASGFSAAYTALQQTGK